MQIGVDGRRVLIVLGLALLVLTLVAPGLALPVADDPGPDRGPEDVQIVEVRENSSAKLWPYTSQRHDFNSATLPINVVVQNNASRVWYLLSQQQDATWNSTTGEWVGVAPEDEGIGINRTGAGPLNETDAGPFNGSNIQWGQARGSTRYTYVHVPEGKQSQQHEYAGEFAGGWIDETYQLHDGTYFGTRHHIRMYESGSRQNAWTAIQAHQEYWDWFRLRHTVGSLAATQTYLEHEFRDEPVTADIRREWYGNGGDVDGWVTIIELEDDRPYVASLALLWLVVGLAGNGTVAPARLGEAVRRRIAAVDAGDARRIALFLVPLGLTFLVRLGSIHVEQSFPGLSPKVIAAGFYPLLAIGLPILTFLAARTLAESESFTLALVGLGVAQLSEYAYLGVANLPIPVVIHRLVLITALGFVAAGGARWSADRTGWNDPLVIGLAAWLFALAWPLLTGL